MVVRESRRSRERARPPPKRSKPSKRSDPKLVLRTGTVKGGIGSDFVITQFENGGIIKQERQRSRSRRRPTQRISAPRIIEVKKRASVDVTKVDPLISELPTTKKLREITRAKPRSRRQKVESFVSKRLGLTKLAVSSQRKFQEERKFLESEKKRLDSIEKKTFGQKLKSVDVNERLKRSKGIGQRVSRSIVKDLLLKPVENAALILGGSAFAKLGAKATLTVSKIAQRSPKVAKALGISGKIFTGAVLTAYTGSVVKEGKKELEETGKLTKTTSNLLRELLLLGVGGKLVSNKKTSTLTKLQQELNKAPKGLQKDFASQIKKVEALSNKAFKTKDIGVVSRLELQQVNTNLKKSLGRQPKLTENVVTVTQNKIFIAKKGSAPKKQKFIDFDVVGVEKVTKDKITVGQTLLTRVRGKFDSRTGKVKIDKILDIKPITKGEANKLLKRFKVGQKVLERIKKIPVKAFERKRVVGVKVKPKVTIEKKGLKKEFVLEPLVGEQPVKAFVRKKKVISKVSLKKKSKVVSGVVDDEIIKLQQFTPVKRGKKAPKISKDKKVLIPAVEQIVAVNNKGQFLNIKKVSSDILVVKSEKLKPVIDVKKFVGDAKTFFVPLKISSKSVKISEPPLVKQTVKAVSKPRKPITVTKSLSSQGVILRPTQKPIIKVASKLKPVVKSKIGIAQKSKSKTRAKTKLVQKIAIKPVLKVSQKLKEKLKEKVKLKIPKLKRAKRKFPIIKIPKKRKKSMKKVIKKVILAQKLKFTPTLLRPSKKNRIVVEDQELLFTGLELR